MGRALLLLFLASCAYAQVRRYEVKGYVASGKLADNAQIYEVETFVKKELKESNFFVHRVVYNEMSNGLLTFIGYFESSKNSQSLLNAYGKTTGFTIVFWREITDSKETISQPELIVDATIPCLNGGTLLVNGTCACGPFTSGDKCQNARCQRKGIPEGGDRCYCPPGWYAQFCEIRGCRPPLNDNLNVDQRSFMLVLPITPSMADVRANLQSSLIDGLGSMPFDNYMVNMFVQINATTYISYITVAGNPQALVNNIQSTTVNAQQQPAAYPIMQSLVDIQQYTRLMNPNSIIFVFTDSPDKDAGPISYTINDNTLELQATQTTMLWRSRAFIFFINDPKMNVNTSLDSYDTYRRMVTFSHGDLFVIGRNEVPIVIKNVLPMLDRPEYIDVRSFAQCDSLTLDLVRDDPNQKVMVFITIDNNPNTPSNVTITAWDTLLGATQIKNKMNGPLWAIFVIPPGWDQVMINVSPKAVCSAKAFISTPTTLLWAYSDDDYIDVGNCMNLAEMPMMITLQPIKFPLFSDFAVEFTNHQTNQPFTWPMDAIVRNEPDCTFVYKVPDLPRCAAGPYTQKYTFRFTSIGKYMRRIHPGFCSHGDKNNGTQPIVDKYPKKGNGSGNTCYLLNNADMGGKLHDFRQIIFALELVQEMQTVTNEFFNMISDLTRDITQADGYRRQFSFVIFDSVSWKAVVSDYDASEFTNKVRQYIGELSDEALHNSNGAFSMDAVYHSLGLEIVSPAIIHVLTMSSPKSADFYRVLPTDVQVNFYYFSQNADVPDYNDFRIMQKQTGGRLIALPFIHIQKPDIFKASVYLNNLLEDTGFQDCSKGVQIRFVVETPASQVELTILASDTAATVTLTDGKNAAINLKSETTLLQSLTTSVYQIARAGKAVGTWTATITAKSSCFVQVRSQSDVNVAVGFTTDVHDDFVARHPFSKRGTNDTSYLIVRATSATTIDQVIVQSTDFNRPWSVGNANGAVTVNGFSKYDENTCAYQYRSGLVQIPVKTSSVRLLVQGTDSTGSKFQRLFNYYTPDNDNGEECNGGNVDAFGQCSCPGNFTGEYCWDRVCAYGSTPSRGICMCWSFYYGERCENVRYVQSSATEPPSPPPTTLKPPTTAPNNDKASFMLSYNVAFLVTFSLLFMRQI